MLLGGSAALLPDLDVLLQKSSDPLFQLELHRQFSHALISFPLAAGLLAVLLRRIWPQRFQNLATAWPLFVGLVSAALLDACTSYGTQLLWPVSSHRFAWNIVPVVDPFFTLPLLLCVVVALRRSSRFALALAAGWTGLYLVHGSVQHHRARSAATEALHIHNRYPQEIVIKPTLGNQILWRATYILENRVYTDAVRTGFEVTVKRGESAPLFVLSSELSGLEQSRLYKDLQRFSILSEGYLVRHPEHENVVGDARYAMLPTSLSPLWGLQYDLHQPEAAPAFVTFRDGSPSVRRQFWEQLRGNGL